MTRQRGHRAGEAQDRLKHGPRADDDTAKSTQPDDESTNDEGMLDDDSARWQSRGMTRALLRSAGDSLESLKLTAKCFKGVKVRNNEPFIGSLRQFRVVQKAVIDTMMLYKKENIVVDMPSTGRTLVLQQAGKIAAGTFVPQMSRTIIVVQRLIDFLPASIRKSGVTCEFVGLEFFKRDIETMFTDLPDRKDTLPTPSHIEFRWREEDDRYGLCQPERQGWKELKKHCEANNITLTHHNGHS